MMIEDVMLNIQAEPAPIQINADGTALIGATRVPLETVIAAFQQGDTPEQIVDSFNVLTLADVYAVIAYYLNHREEVEAYLREQADAAEQLYREIAANRPEMFNLRQKSLRMFDHIDYEVVHNSLGKLLHRLEQSVPEELSSTVANALLFHRELERMIKPVLVQSQTNLREAAMLQQKFDRIIEQDLAKFVAKDDDLRLMRNYRELLTAESPMQLIYRLAKQDGFHDSQMYSLLNSLFDLPKEQLEAFIQQQMNAQDLRNKLLDV